MLVYSRREYNYFHHNFSCSNNVVMRHTIREHLFCNNPVASPRFVSTMYGLLESVRGTTQVPGSARGKNCTQETQLQNQLPLPNYIHCQPLVSKFCFLSHFLSELKFPLTIWRACGFVQQPTEHNAWVALSAPDLHVASFVYRKGPSNASHIVWLHLQTAPLCQEVHLRTLDYIESS
jgi:hypothetical protein